MADNELNLAELHNVTSEEMYQEALADSRIPSGDYVGSVKVVYGRTVSDTSEFNPGREYASLFIELYNKDDVSTKEGSLYTKVSWDKRLTRSGKLDNQSKHWLELMRAVGASPKDSIPEILNKAQQTMFNISVEETFRVMPDDVLPEHQKFVYSDAISEAWIRLEPDEDAAFDYYVNIGLEPMTTVRRYRKL